jgi:hypothetical protein
MPATKTTNLLKPLILALGIRHHKLNDQRPDTGRRLRNAKETPSALERNNLRVETRRGYATNKKAQPAKGLHF